MTEPRQLAALQETLWRGSVPLEIRLAAQDCRTYDNSHPYLIQHPRLSYLPFLLPRLHAFFSPHLIDPSIPAHTGWLSHEGVPLKWQHPLGLLYDLFSGFSPFLDTDTPSTSSLSPWRLVLHFSDYPAEHLIVLDADGKVHHDAFINAVKEADFLRNGTGKTIMSMSKDDSMRLWHSVQEHDLRLFNSVNEKFLTQSSGAPLRHVPMKVYLPASPTSASTPILEESSEAQVVQPRGILKTVQAPIPFMLSAKDPQTLGTALHSMLPTVFPSRRNYIHANAVLHGAVVPLASPLAELMRFATYADGWLHVGVFMVG